VATTTREANGAAMRAREAHGAVMRAREANGAAMRARQANGAAMRAREANGVATPPREANVVATPPREANVVATPPREANVVATPPREANVVATPPREVNVVATPPREANVVATQPPEANGVATPPREANVVATPPREANGAATRPHSANGAATHPRVANAAAPAAADLDKPWFTQERMFFVIAIVAIYLGWRLPTERYLTPKTGFGYALGIVGGSLVLVLLLYSIRKRVSWLGFMGTVNKWFEVHMVLGVLAPICILYHANFTLGATNSNVAFWSMMVVAASGLVGRYIYRHIHFGLYGRKVNLSELRSGADRLRALESTVSFLPELVGRLEREEKRPRRSLQRSPRALASAHVRAAGAEVGRARLDGDRHPAPASAPRRLGIRRSTPRCHPQGGRVRGLRTALLGMASAARAADFYPDHCGGCSRDRCACLLTGRSRQHAREVQACRIGNRNCDTRAAGDSCPRGQSRDLAHAGQAHGRACEV